MVAGDVTEAEVRKLAQETYGKVKREPGVLAVARARRSRARRRAARRAARPARAQIAMQRYYMTPSYKSAEAGEAEALDTLSIILGDGPTSRLYRQLVEEKDIAANAGASFSGVALDSGTLKVYAVAGEGVKPEALEQAIDAAIALFVKDGPTEEELEQAKGAMIASYVYSADNQAGLAQRYGSNLVIGRTIADIEEWPDRVAKVTAADVKKVAAKYLELQVLGDRLPDPASRRERGGDKMRKERGNEPLCARAAQASRATVRIGLRSLIAACCLAGHARAADIQQVRSPGGISAWLVEEKSLPIIAIRFAFDGGSAQEPVGKEGTAGLLAAMLDQGAGDLSGPAYQKQIEKLAVRLSFDSDRDTFFGNFETLTANLGKASELLRLAVTKPLLDPAILERTRAQLLARAGFEAGDDNKLANAQWMAQSFAGHTYSRAIAGTPDSLKVITRDDLDGYRKRVMSKGTLRVAAVGDIDAATLGKVLDEVFGGLPAEPQLTPIVDVAPKAVPKPTVVKLEGPQSVTIFGRRGIQRNDPDYYRRRSSLSQLLGGGSSDARLVREVREKRGLAYWVYTLLYNFKHATMLIGGFASPNKDVATSLDLVRGEFKALAERGPTQEEVDAAKSYLIGSFVLSLDSNAKIAEQMLRAQIAGPGARFRQPRKARLAKVTRADVARVARSLLDGRSVRRHRRTAPESRRHRPVKGAVGRRRPIQISSAFVCLGGRPFPARGRSHVD